MKSCYCQSESITKINSAPHIADEATHGKHVVKVGMSDKLNWLIVLVGQGSEVWTSGVDRRLFTCRDTSEKRVG